MNIDVFEDCVKVMNLKEADVCDPLELRATKLLILETVKMVHKYLPREENIECDDIAPLYAGMFYGANNEYLVTCNDDGAYDLMNFKESDRPVYTGVKRAALEKLKNLLDNEK